MSTPPPPPPGQGVPADGASLPAPPPLVGQPGAGRLGPGASPFGLLPPPLPGPSRGSRGPLIGVLTGVVVLIAGAAGVLVLRTGDDGDAAASTPSRPSATTPASTATPTSPAAPTTTAAPTTSAAPTTTKAPGATEPPVTAPAMPEGSIDLGRGVFLPTPTGWDVVSGPDEPLTISDGRLWFSAQVLVRPPAEGPQAVLQELVDTFDADTAAVSYSPVTFEGSVAGSIPADHYRLIYSTFDTDGARLSGRLDLYLRGDGLVAVEDAWGDTDSDPADTEVPQELTDTLGSTLTAAPAIGPAETLPVAAPFRVVTSHAFIGTGGLAGFSVPPGFDATETTADGGVTIAGASNGRTDLLGMALAAQDTVESVFDLVRFALESRYVGLVFDDPSPQGAQEGWQRLGAGFAGTLDGRPIAGGVDTWQVPGDTAYGFAYVYFADVAADGANPDPNATQFAYAAYADSL